jgi:predicted Zn finger-like uncharacterized protein
MQITHCPECETAFKVTPEHLASAKGWVRCGRCGAVFEALKHLEPATSSPPMGSVPAPSLAAETEADDTLSSMRPMSQATSAARASSPRTTRRLSWEIPASLLLTLSVLLVFILLLQAVLWKRHWLAAQEPALRDALTALCAPVGCEVGWPRAPEALLIESSSFTRDPDNFYTVQVRIKNAEHHAVAAPSLELTLVDAQEDVVLRRVFAPQEIGLADHVPALREAKASLSFELADPVIERVTGYRALLFYP